MLSLSGWLWGVCLVCPQSPSCLRFLWVDRSCLNSIRAQLSTVLFGKHCPPHHYNRARIITFAGQALIIAPQLHKDRLRDSKLPPPPPRPDRPNCAPSVRISRLATMQQFHCETTASVLVHSPPRRAGLEPHSTARTVSKGARAQKLQ